MSINIQAEGCECPPGQCAHFVEPDSHCINRLTGDVRTMTCPVCHPDGKGACWHQNGECLRCRRNASPQDAAP